MNGALVSSILPQEQLNELIDETYTKRPVRGVGYSNERCDFSYDRIREEDQMNIALDARGFEYPRSYSSDLEHGMLTPNITAQMSKSKASSCGISRKARM